MPDDFQQPHDPSTRPSERPDDSSRGVARRPAAPASRAPKGLGTTDLGQFSLLADPTTISGEDASRPNESNDNEINPLRSALYARSREVAELQRDHSREHNPAPTSLDAEAPEPARTDGELLNSSQARKLARDAHARERAIRAELSTARDALHAESTNPQTTEASSEEAEPRWRTRALVSGPSAREKGSPETRLQTFPSATPETLLRAEILELQATLSLARDTTRSQKTEIGDLRIRLEALEGQHFEPDSQEAPAIETLTSPPEASSSEEERSQRAVDDVQIELTRLRERLRHNEREFEARDAERVLLKQTLEERETGLAAVRVRLDALQDRFDVQTRSLDHARLKFDQERDRNTEAQGLLARLRETLGEEPMAAPSAECVDPAQRPQGISEPTVATSLHTIRSDSPASGLSDRVPSMSDRATASLFDESMALDGSSIFSRPVIFDAWQDDQVRRHFGPMGIDTIIDLLRAPLARRHDPGRSEMPLLLIGRGAWEWASTLAEGLIQNGTPAFTIYVSDPAGRAPAADGELGQDRPIRAFLRDLAFPSDPAQLRASLTEIEAVALISRDFLSTQTDVDPWLEVLASASTAGTCLLFAERTGVGAISVPPELSSIGDRIWKLMPERYKRIERSAKIRDASPDPMRVASWNEAFALSQRSGEFAPTNDLLARLRNRFRLEMLARFGFLAEGFVATSIGANFDPSAARDRKFLSQIADVDDRKIEAGVVPALHLVAVVDHEPDAKPDAGAENRIAPPQQG